MTLWLFQVVANLTENHIFNNLGYHIMDVVGFGRVRLPIYQTFFHNSFHKWGAPFFFQFSFTHD